MSIIGLTGQSGSGKTVVSEMFLQNGFYHINCDLVAREVTSKGSECISDLVNEFSESILNPDKTLNRKELGKTVFADREKLDRLNAIIFPYIIKHIEDTITILKKDGVKLILLDAPTLFESGIDKICDIIVIVTADYEKRINRIIKRDEITAEDAEKRLSSQKSTDFFKNNSDFVIDNSFDLDTLQKSTKQTILLIQERLKCNGNTH